MSLAELRTPEVAAVDAQACTWAAAGALARLCLHRACPKTVGGQERNGLVRQRNPRQHRVQAVAHVLPDTRIYFLLSARVQVGAVLAQASATSVCSVAVPQSSLQQASVDGPVD